MIFASKDPMTFTPGYEKGQSGIFGRMKKMQFPTHEFNPILVEFRRSAPWDLVKDAYSEGTWAEVGKAIPTSATPEQQDHANRVFKKIVAVFGTVDIG